MISTFVLVALLSIAQKGAARRQQFNVHWNLSNPIFRIDNTAHVMDVRLHDQVHILCPRRGGGGSGGERYVVHNVGKEDYDSCRVSDDRPERVVAICNDPDASIVFTITFRAFSPTPLNLEFQPGKDYYFISTSSPDDLMAKSGGRCLTHNMKVIFKVKGKGDRVMRKRRPRKKEEKNEEEKEVEENVISYKTRMSGSGGGDNLELPSGSGREKKVIKQEASRMQSSSLSSSCAISFGKEKLTWICFLLIVAAILLLAHSSGSVAIASIVL